MRAARLAPSLSRPDIGGNFLVCPLCHSGAMGKIAPQIIKPDRLQQGRRLRLKEMLKLLKPLVDLIVR